MQCFSRCVAQIGICALISKTFDPKHFNSVQWRTHKKLNLHLLTNLLVSDILLFCFEFVSKLLTERVKINLNLILPWEWHNFICHNPANQVIVIVIAMIRFTVVLYHSQCNHIQVENWISRSNILAFTMTISVLPSHRLTKKESEITYEPTMKVLSQLPSEKAWADIYVSKRLQHMWLKIQATSAAPEIPGYEKNLCFREVRGLVLVERKKQGILYCWWSWLSVILTERDLGLYCCQSDKTFLHLSAPRIPYAFFERISL